jgi:RHS repeat-associated protein
VDTTYGSTVFQDNEYAWRSNGTLESRLARPATGLISTREETFGYDVLNRVTLAETFINSSNTRDLEYDYDLFGNIEEKTSTLTGDVDVAGYNYGAGSAGPHAVTSATVAGTLYTLSYDDNGAVTQYDIAGTSDDKYLAYNVFNQPTKIVIGDSIDDTTPVAVDEFAYGPGGQRYARRTKWQDGANTITEEVVYVGAVEIISDDADPNLTTITKTQLSPNVMHVKMQGTNTVEFFEYAHRDHLGSIEVVTDDNGNVLDQLAFEPFGSRKKKDWTANISSTERDDLLDLDWDHARKARGFTRHEHLDRTGFIHMNGRVYDAVLGRFISPDPIVQSPEHSQSWNRHAYVWNSSTSFVDPSGFSKWQDVTERMKEAIDGFASVPLTFYGGGIFADDKVVEQGIPHIGGESITSSTDFAGLDYTIDGCGGISPYCVGVGGLGNDPASKRLRQQEAYRQSMAVMYAWRVARDDEQQMWIDVIEAQVSAPFIAEIPVLLSRAGWRYLASGSAPSLNALPGPRQIAAAWGAGIYRHGGLMTGIEHIMYRHGYNAAFKGVSRFAEGTRLRDISNYVDLALRYGKVTLTRPGTYEVVHDLGRIIGTSQGGTATSILKVFVQDGIIRTAFPF